MPPFHYAHQYGSNMALLSRADVIENTRSRMVSCKVCLLHEFGRRSATAIARAIRCQLRGQHEGLMSETRIYPLGEEAACSGAVLEL